MSKKYSPRSVRNAMNHDLLSSEQDSSKQLSHLALIPDGNRRWARFNRLPTREGHEKGFLEVAPMIIKTAWDYGIHTVTLWFFSTENWKRSDEEVSYLMEVYHTCITGIITKLSMKYDARIIHLGRKDRIPEALLNDIALLEKATSTYKQHLFNIALDYGGLDEVTRSVQKCINDTAIQNITPEALLGHSDTAEQPFPFPDLVMRTSGEQRLSGFMPLQTTYSELLFLEKHFPDLTSDDIKNAVDYFHRRQRRFGQ